MSDLATGYVVQDEWDDAAWRAVAAKRTRTMQEYDLYVNGPREHPFGLLAHRAEHDGRTLIFPSEAAHGEWVAKQAKPAE